MFFIQSDGIGGNPAALDSCVAAVVREGLVRHTVTYDLRGPPLDLGPAARSRPDDDGASRRHRRVFVEEVERPEEEAHGVAGRGRVGDVF